MEITPKQPTAKGRAETFTGDVWIDAIANGQEPSRVRVNLVRFSPGARSAWHSHALGQTLHVTDGAGLVQPRGGDIVRIRAGDVIYTPAEEEHWHGATPHDFMAHLSITKGVGSSEKPETTGGRTSPTPSTTARRSRGYVRQRSRSMAHRGPGPRCNTRSLRAL